MNILAEYLVLLSGSGSQLGRASSESLESLLKQMAGPTPSVSDSEGLWGGGDCEFA